jgi:hypothetical protein
MTEKTEHSIGPWRAEYTPTETGRDFWSIYAANGDAVEYMTLRGGKELEANARLTAAGPELLEALKDARYALYGNGPGNPKIDAAIAKAEGRE